jgi:hypothetical protein
VLRSAAQKWATTKTAAGQRIAANFGHNQEMPGLIDPYRVAQKQGAVFGGWLWAKRRAL